MTAHATPAAATRPETHQDGTAVAADADLLILGSGAILAAVGTWRTWPVRARLCYYPDRHGATSIAGRAYAKVTYERFGAIGDCAQVLALPGENHYLVGPEQVRRRVPCAPLDPAAPAAVREHAAAFAAAGMVPRLTGSRALGCESGASDFDWVVWCEHPVQVRQVVDAEPRSGPDLHFGLDHAVRKYEHFTHLDPDRIAGLFSGRWRHVTWPDEGHHMSYLPASTSWTADAWRDLRAGRHQVSVTGTVTETARGCFAPTLIGLDADQTGPTQVVTWLFLYRGALSVGDRVTVHGRPATGPTGPVLLVEEADDAIFKH